MKILPINNIQNNRQQNFKAKFPKKDVKEFLREIENCDVDIIAKLYTMLDIIKMHPGKTAKIKHIGIWHQILIDEKSVNESNKYLCAFHALQDATVNHKNTLLKKDTLIKRMSEEEFKNAYYNNNRKTITDIENMFEA